MGKGQHQSGLMVVSAVPAGPRPGLAFLAPTGHDQRHGTALAAAQSSFWRRYIPLALLRLAAPLAALVFDGPRSAIGVLLLQEGGFWLTRKLADGSRAARRLFWAAYAVRAAVAMGLYGYLVARGGAGSLFQDDYTYDLVAEWLVRIARGDGITVFPGHQHVLDGLYVYLLAALYAVLGHVPLVANMLNATLGAVSVVLMARVATSAFGQRAGQIAGWAACLWPTLVLWSAVTLKETLVLFGAVLALLSMQRLLDPRYSTRRSSDLLLLLAALLLLFDVRPPLFGLLAVLIAAAVTVNRARRLPRRYQVGLLATLTAAGFGVLLAARIGAPDSTLAGLSRPDDLARTLRFRRAAEAVAARSQIGLEAADWTRDVLDVPTYREAESFDVRGDIVEPLGYALLAPAPWQARSNKELAASGEMLLWYLFIAGAAVALLRIRPMRPFTLLLAGYAVGAWVFLALAEGNLGNLLRHRIMLAPAVVVLGSGGLVLLARSVPERWRTHAARLGVGPPQGSSGSPSPANQDQRPGTAVRRS